MQAPSMWAPESPASGAVSESQLASLRLQGQRDLPEATEKGPGTLHDAHVERHKGIGPTDVPQDGYKCPPCPPPSLQPRTRPEGKTVFASGRQVRWARPRTGSADTAPGWLAACSLRNFPDAAAGGRETKVKARMSHGPAPARTHGPGSPHPRGERPTGAGRTGEAAQGPPRRDPGSGLGPRAATRPV